MFQNKKVWTDCPLCYPIIGDSLDEPNEPAPIRQVELLGWDNNKYCLIRFDDNVYEVKLGYIYLSPGRCGEVRSIPSHRVWVLKSNAIERITNMFMYINYVRENLEDELTETEFVNADKLWNSFSQSERGYIDSVIPTLSWWTYD